MAHGLADYGALAQRSTVYGLADMAELAARVGSPDLFDRRGDVVWIETFENDLVNWSTSVASGTTPYLTAAESLHGNLSVILQGQNVALTSVGISRQNPLPVDSRLGVEFAFLPNSRVQNIRLDQIIYTGSMFYPAYVYIELDTGDMYYYDSDGNWTVFSTGLTLRQDGLTWHNFKVVYDLDTKYYLRTIIDNVQYDMSTLAMRALANANDPMLQVTIQSIANSPGGSPIAYVTNIICTQNEP